MTKIMLKKSIIALLFAAIGLMLLIFSFVLPWWGYHNVYDDGEYHSEWSGGISIASGFWYYQGQGDSPTIQSGTSLYMGDYSVPALFGTTAILMIIAIIFTFLLIISILLFEFGKIRKRMPMIFGVIAIIFCILAPIIFMVAFPNAVKADTEKRIEEGSLTDGVPSHDDPSNKFFGSYKEDSFKQTWGGDIGWFLAIISFIMILISFILIVSIRKNKKL